MKCIYKTIRSFLLINMKFFFRIQVINSKYIPEGSSLLVGNHTSIFDGPLVMSSTNKELFFMVKKELHDGLKGILFKRLNTIPVNRGKDTTKAKEKANATLKNGKSVVIFPEGTINKTKDVIMKFKKGAVHFAKENKCPIVPFIIKGKYKFFRKNVIIEYLKPYYVESDDLDFENEKLMNIFRKELENK